MLRQHQVPMLLVPSEQEHTWDIYNVLDDKFLKLKLSLLYDKRFSGSSQGWLVVANKDHTITLHKPYFISKDGISDVNTSVLLPSLFPPDDDFDPENDPLPEGYNDLEEYLNIIEGYDYYVRKTLITADPLANPNDCTIVVIYGPFNELGWIRYGKDTTWRKIDEYCGFEDIVRYKNQLYAIKKKGELLAFDPCTGIVKLVATRISVGPTANIKRYLVEWYGEFLLVERYMDFSAHRNDRMTKMYKVFKLDFGGARWIEIKSLGDLALFIGDNSSMAVLASTFDGCQPNCIYYTHDEVGLQTRTYPFCDLGVYNLESKRKLYFNDLDSSALHRMFKRPPIWVLPLPDVC
ncbi:hypothetical protein TorRG33x02_068150 [Trema orientale]|uniref:KIB1-4 beta-propeller domain-containing protein n=1 Tax=Trema orientale TaxID=63057 RepID=A0A2P5FHT6_TREOI|nr:hypothetical protein TorRG33x02_068150 [Trema orientale]